MQKIKVILKFILNIVRRFILAIKYTIKYSSYKSPSYYSELKQKTELSIYFDQLKHILKYGEINQFYYLYGLDISGRNFEKEGYIAYNKFMELRNKRNYKSTWNSYVCLLRDKSLFAIIANNFKFPCSQNIGNLKNDESVLLNNGDVKTIFEVLEKYKDIFCKPFDSECGEGIFCLGKTENGFTLNDILTTKDEIVKFIHSLKTEIIIQNRIIQHTEMNNLYKSSINTLRIITIRNNKTGIVEHLHSLLRIGANGNVVDNWAKGGIAIGIDTIGRLSEYGFYKPQYGLKTSTHPNSGIIFKDFIVPYYQDAVRMCIEFHETLKYIDAIGWDVAITPDGPCFIEGNDNFEISLHQAYGGLRKQFESKLK